jgi:putative PEP-CTERM system TPR-repeat lipoprotein
MRKLNRNMGNSILLAAFLLLIGCSGQGANEQQMLQAAKTYLDKRDLMAASIELRNSLVENPQNAEARFLLAGINLEIGDLAAAEKEYRRAGEAGWQAEETQIGISKVLIGQYRFRKLLDEIEIKDDWSVSARADLLGLRAAAEASLGDVSQAKTTLARGAELKADAFQILKTTAILHLGAGETQEAVTALKDALSVYQDNSELLLLRATAEQQEKKFPEAAETYRNIIDQGPSRVISATNRQARIGLSRLAILEKNYEEAESTLAPLFKENKNDPDANYLGSLLAFERGDYKLAENRIRKLIKMAPDHAPFNLLMGKIAYALQNYEQAANHLNAYLSTSPDDTKVVKLLVSTYIALDQLKLARSALQPALSRNPNDASLLALMSQLEVSRGDTDAAIRGLQESIEAAPDKAALHKQLAEVYIQVRETDKAIEALKTYQEMSNNSAEAKNLMIVAYVRVGKFEQAINIAQDMLATSTEDAGVLSLNGSLYAASGNNQEARKYFEKALHLDKDFATAAIGLARIEGNEGNIDKAVDIYKGLADSKKGGTAPMLSLAEIARQQGRIDDMVNWLEMARETAPDEIAPRISLANHYYQHQQLEKADLLVQEAIKISPANTDLLTLHGRILIAQQRYNEARPPLKALVEKEPDSVVARTLLGEVNLRLGYTGNAREHLGKALEKQPDYAPALILMAGMELQANSPKRSLPYAKRLQQALPDFYMGYKLEGDALMSMQDYANARKAFLVAWQKQQTAELAIKLYDATKRSGSIDDAITPLITWLDGHAEDNKVRFFLASAYQGMKQNDKAILEYGQILENAPDDVAALNNLAWLYSLGEDPRALQLAERAFQVTKGVDPLIRDTYGWILVQQGQHEKGRGVLKQAVAQAPDNPEIQYHYAAALLKSGRKDEGIRMLEKLISNNKAFSGRDDARQILEEYKKAN